MKLRGEIHSPEDLGRMLQQGRLLAGMSQRDLATQIGATQRYVWELESGKPSILMTRLFDALRATGVTLQAELDDRQNDDQPRGDRRNAD